MTEEQKANLIEELAKFNWESTHSGGWTWAELINRNSSISKSLADLGRKTAKKQIKFLLAHGLYTKEG